MIEKYLRIIYQKLIRQPPVLIKRSILTIRSLIKITYKYEKVKINSKDRSLITRIIARCLWRV
jgi:hypothetical protein